jgi:hypothetical protein
VPDAQELLRHAGHRLLVPFLTTEYGASSLFSAARILGNFILLLQNDAPFGDAVKALMPLGVFTRLTKLFFEVADAEIKYNIIICLPFVCEFIPVSSRELMCSFLRVVRSSRLCLRRGLCWPSSSCC